MMNGFVEQFKRYAPSNSILHIEVSSSKCISIAGDISKQKAKNAYREGNINFHISICQHVLNFPSIYFAFHDITGTDELNNYH